MRKRFFTILFTAVLAVSLLTPVPVSAKTPAKMKALKSYIKANGTITRTYQNGADKYVAKISYQKKKNRFLFKCTYTNGRSDTTVKMYMPASKLKKIYTASFNETVRAGKRTAKISGKAKLRRKAYSNTSSVLRFTRRNRTSLAKSIKNPAYQSAANSSLRIAVSLWEYGLRTGPAMSLKDLGFKKISF